MCLERQGVVAGKLVRVEQLLLKIKPQMDNNPDTVEVYFSAFRARQFQVSERWDCKNRRKGRRVCCVTHSHAITQAGRELHHLQHVGFTVT